MTALGWDFELIGGPYAGAGDGPVWDGEALLFCLVSEGLILRYDPQTGSTTEFRKYTAGTRGLGFDANGTIYGCQSGSRRIVRFNHDGSATPLENRLYGQFHNYPDDLVADRQGRIWFSDPIDAITVGGHAWPHIDPAVLRLEPSADGTWSVRRMTFDSSAPRGLALSLDEQILYVGDNSSLPELRAYPIGGDGALASCALLHTFEAGEMIDGLCLDAGGNILACIGGPEGGPPTVISVISPSGQMLETHPVPAGRPTNCAFGDAGLGSLYVTTADGCLYRVPNPGRPGLVLYTSPPRAGTFENERLAKAVEKPPRVWLGRPDAGDKLFAETQALRTDMEASGFERIVPRDTMLETIATGFIGTEGPVWCAREGHLFWSDIIGDKIYRWRPGHGTSVFIDPSGHANGLTYDPEGRLVVAGFGSRIIWRVEPDGRKNILASRYEGKKLNAPNDIVVKSDGSIYWTEGTGALFHLGEAGDDVQQYLDFRAVFHLAPDGLTITPVTIEVPGCNGLAFSPDESLLYVNGRRQIKVFDVQPDGSLKNGRLFYEDEGKEHGQADGMKVDVEGNVYCRSSGGIHVIDPRGNLLGRIRIPDMSNLGWGDADWKTMYIAGRSNIYRTRLNIPGVPV